MLEIQARKFEKLFNRVIEMHITGADMTGLYEGLEELDVELERRVVKAFSNAFCEGRIVIHINGKAIRTRK